ncbi:MAG: geranylgeranylglyceryl/heptaprenylglyceryl phosphate synthase [Bacteroidales bacterium]|nr:geranylgeranylglyceryl/heptaprenylglyceryl phosphate synthase [Bacteroidales bacterium]
MMIKSLKRQKCIALLMDPDKYEPDDITKLKDIKPEHLPDFILVGGSLTRVHPDEMIINIKKSLDIPVVLFPGSLLQITDKADIILFISLISGRNPDLLIGNHVIAAPHLKNMDIEIIATGYILINCGTKTSVEYMSQTNAIPASKTDIVVATAMAGEMLGLKLIYLEGGSGASHPVPPDMIKAVRGAVSVPLIIGGGLRNPGDIKKAFDAGADMVVLGNGYEDDPGLLVEASKIRYECRMMNIERRMKK